MQAKRIVAADSSANLLRAEGVDFASVPLKIQAGEREYVDDAALDVAGMLAELREYKGKSGTACPGVGDWLEAFGEADEVLGIAITSHLSGCYNSARLAAEEYTEQHPDRKAFILDSLSTGPEMELLVEKACELTREGADFEQASEALRQYSQRTHLVFSLESLVNFARNGRVSSALATAASLLGIRIVGRASREGELEPLHKCRGEKRAIRQLWDCMLGLGYSGGKVRIRHSENPDAAQRMAEEIRSAYPGAEIHIGPNRGLCSFYAEKGGVLVGFEGN